MRIFDGIEKNNLENPTKVGLSYGIQQLTYQEIVEQAHILAECLQSRYLEGERLVVCLENPVSQLLFLLASSISGMGVILADVTLPEEFIGQLREDENIVELVNQDFLEEMLNDKNVNSNKKRGIILKKYPEAEAIFLGALSSGSTGKPKVIWRDQKSWTSAFPVQSDIFSVSSADVLYLSGSLSYTANLNAALHILNEGGHLVIAKKKWPKTWLLEIKEKGVTSIFMVPANYRLLCKVAKTKNRCGIRSLVSAGEKMDQATLRNLQNLFPEATFTEYYGASETGHISYATREDLLKKPDSVGRAFPGVTIRIKEDQIHVRSPYLANRYRPEVTIGDIGKIDQEGYLYLLGREGGLINSAGVKIMPEQLENLFRQLPLVDEVVVAGVTDELRGQKVVAFVKPVNSLLPNEKIIDEIRNFAKNKIPSYNLPAEYCIVENIPKNYSEKTDRSRLVAEYILKLK